MSAFSPGGHFIIGKAYGLAFAAALLAFAYQLVPAAAAARLSATGTFVYSNACSSPGGDFSGYRVKLKRQGSHIKVAIEFNDSGPEGNAAAQDVKFNDANGKLGFSFQGGDLKYLFQGSIDHNALRGTVDAVDDRQPQAVPITHELVELRLLKKVPKHLAECGGKHPLRGVR